ncbi:MAG: AAA family ATPase [Clostridiales bacterium]|nr:AAA family ATPase [Candidatus Crickella caballi]
MNKLIIVTGDLAAGKSTFSKRLADRYGVTAYNKDDIKEVLVDTIGFSNREENLKLSKAAVGLMCYRFTEAAKARRDIILEANFRDGELIHIEELAKERGYGIMTLCMQGDVETLYERFQNRIKNENRHPAHQSVGIQNSDDFKAYLESIRNEYLPGKAIRIDASDFSYNEDESLLDEIDAFMKADM